MAPKCLDKKIVKKHRTVVETIYFIYVTIHGIGVVPMYIFVYTGQLLILQFSGFFSGKCFSTNEQSHVDENARVILSLPFPLERKVSKLLENVAFSKLIVKWLSESYTGSNTTIKSHVVSALKELEQDRNSHKGI